MKRFRVKINAVLLAEDITDAFRRVAEHFAALAEGREPQVFTSTSELTIEPEPCDHDFVSGVLESGITIGFDICRKCGLWASPRLQGGQP